jgi:hypothetical protein
LNESRKPQGDVHKLRNTRVGFYRFVTSRIENNNNLYGFAFQEKGDLESRKVSLRIVFFYIILITGANIEKEKALNFLLLP